MVGQTISHYKVIEKIDQGGMGEVYRARDTKLNPDVTLKVSLQGLTIRWSPNLSSLIISSEVP